VICQQQIQRRSPFAYLFATSPLELHKICDGTFVPDLNGRKLLLGKSYTVQAKPASGQIFFGWPAPRRQIKKPQGHFITPSGFEATFVTNPFPACGGRLQRDLSGSDPNGFRPENAGFLRLQVTTQGSFSGKVTMQEGNLLPFGEIRSSRIYANIHCAPRSSPPSLYATTGSNECV